MSLEQIINEISLEISKIDGVILVILFGSIARGSYSDKSDLDLLIVTEEGRIKRKIEDAIANIDSNIRIQPLIRTTKELGRTDIGLLKNIFLEGKVILLKKPFEIDAWLILKQKPHIIASFSLKNLKQKEKVRFNTALYGTKKEKYQYRGLLEMHNGKKLGLGCVLIPHKSKKPFEEFMKSYNIDYQTEIIWK